uniref:Phosphatidylinositol-3,5-bisphosphate 3-phosphatase n=1 Tax=Rhabditophanes sp. KR3021 TaxID=114890 RepID=A0AC35TY04_9BILA
MRKVSKQFEENLINRFSAAWDVPVANHFPEPPPIPIYQTTELMPWFLDGEAQQFKEKDVNFLSLENEFRGDVYITNYRFCFESNDSKKRPFACHIPLGLISKIEKYGHSSNLTKPLSYGIEISLKDQRKFKIAYQLEMIRKHMRKNLFDQIHKFAFPVSHNMPFFATVYKSKASYDFNFWELIKLEAEYMRMGVPNQEWAVCTLNDTYTFCPSYPKVFFIPKEAAERGPDFLNKVAGMRSSKRIPVLAWLDSDTGCALVRSSQPMVGLKFPSKKTSEDEMYLNMIINTQKSNTNDVLAIIDARPQANAQMNRAKGGGFENYEKCTLEFMDIQNIHVIRDSLKKVRDVCSVYTKHEMLNEFIRNTKWLSHLQTILTGAETVVLKMKQPINPQTVLVHCSDGWDRTAQLTALAMLMMDPHYRSINGFAILVEKEWCSFGHKFAHRLGHGVDKHGDQERSPIFIQFIDCVWQMINAFPDQFQFNEKCLLFLLEELYTCRFGTFLFNNEKERMKEHQCLFTTVSIWSHISANLSEYANEKYDHGTQTNKYSNVLLLSDVRHGPVLWKNYYSRYSEDKWSLSHDDTSLVHSLSIAGSDESSYEVINYEDATSTSYNSHDIARTQSQFTSPAYTKKLYIAPPSHINNHHPNFANHDSSPSFHHNSSYQGMASYPSAPITPHPIEPSRIAPDPPRTKLLINTSLDSGPTNMRSRQHPRTNPTVNYNVTRSSVQSPPGNEINFARF